MIRLVRQKPIRQNIFIDPEQNLQRNDLYSRITSCFQCFRSRKNVLIVPNNTDETIEEMRPSSTQLHIQEANSLFWERLNSEISDNSISDGSYSSQEEILDSEQMYVKAKTDLAKKESALENALLCGEGEKEQIDLIKQTYIFIEAGLQRISEVDTSIQIVKQCLEEETSIESDVFTYCKSQVAQAKQIAEEIHEISHKMHQNEISWLENLAGQFEEELLLNLKTSLTLEVVKYRMKAHFALLLTKKMDRQVLSMDQQDTFEAADFQTAKTQLEINERELYNLERDIADWEHLDLEQQREIYDQLYLMM